VPELHVAVGAGRDGGHEVRVCGDGHRRDGSRVRVVHRSESSAISKRKEMKHGKGDAV
jgi:hypothetical protein